ncbi:MAG: endopeptidase La [Clostridia bacterium]|nr:endopeptidase La [Clostridia bacterium]
MEQKTNNFAEYPAMALRGLVAFPDMMLTVDVGRKKSVHALNFAMEQNSPVYLVTQKDITVENPENDDIYKTGCVCRVRQILKMPDGSVKALLNGLYRARHTAFKTGGEHFIAEVCRLDDQPIKNRPVYIESMIRRIRSSFEEYLQVSPKMPADIVMTVASSDNLSFLCDYIAFNVPAPFDDKQYVLEQLNVITRAKVLLELLSKEREITEIDNRIGEKTRYRIDESQKDFYLKEQIKVISDELYGDESGDEIDEYHERVQTLVASDGVKEKIHSEINKLSKMPPGAHEATNQRAFIELCLDLPWDKERKAAVDINRAARILDRDFYGLKRVKERILEAISVYALAPEVKGQIICLAGPPGVGKTSIGKTIAECMGRDYARVSLGGLHDEAEIRGHRKTYVGAMPGKIISAMKKAGSCNPVILLDEIDKIGNDYKGDPASAMLEVLDPEQNCTFTDNFLDMPYDLSRAVFITTANSLDTIPLPLLDRMEIIEIDSYTREEKYNIAKRHLLARQIKNHGVTQKNCRISGGTLYALIDFYTREAGVRALERAIGSLCAKAAKKIAEGSETEVNIKPQDLQALIGHKKYHPEEILPRDEVGIINGLAWTRVGGAIMQMEIAVMEGTGKTELTGNLGDVMKESAAAAVSYVRTAAGKYGVSPDFYKTRDIHIHATEAATPKDGPSAGVTIATALISALTGRAVRRDIAMTGEITITGRVLAIGGLKEKSMAAYRGGVKQVFIPEDNIPDLDDVDAAVKNKVKFIPVKHIDEIIRNALVPDTNTHTAKKVSSISRAIVN